jgi:SAM-dependent methyltransferase
VPLDWLSNPLDGQRTQRFFANLCCALGDLGASLDFVRVPFGSDVAPRLVGAGQLYLSYHSRGEQPGLWHLKETYIPPYYTFDRLGYAGWSELAVHPSRFLPAIDAFDLDRARALIAELRDRFRETDLSKYPQADAPEEVVPEGCVFLPLQTTDDPVAGFCDFDQLEVLTALAAAGTRAGVPVVVKRHPFCKDPRVEDALRVVARHNPGVSVIRGSIHGAIARARSVVGANSGVCFEALVHGVPVFTFARSDFRIATTPLERPDALSDVLAASSTVPREFVERFVGWYLAEYCVHGEDVAGITRRLAMALEEVGAPRSPQTPSAAQLLLDGYAELERRRRHLAQEEARLAVAAHHHETERADLEHSRAEAARRAVELEDTLRAHVGASSAAAAERDRAIVQCQGLTVERDRAVTAAAVMTEVATRAFSGAAQHIARRWSLLRSRSWRLTAPYRRMGQLMRGQPPDEPILPRDLRDTVASDHYARLHATDAGYQTNNWLLDCVPAVAAARPASLLELGCGNGRFLEAASLFVPTVIGIDWARSPLVPSRPNIRLIEGDITQVELPAVDLVCSADVLEHLPTAAIPPLLRRLAHCSPRQLHVLACYDDGHSHVAVHDPGTWLAFFREAMPDARLASLEVRRDDPGQLVCVVSTFDLARPPDAGAALVGARGEELRLDLGAGDTRRPGFLSVDIRPEAAPDLVADVADPPAYLDGFVAEMRARHVLEHLDRQRAEHALRRWRQLLVPGGVLHVVVPDLEFHARQLLGEVLSPWPDQEAHAMAGFFGWSAPERGGGTWDRHQWGYSWSALERLLEQVGFDRIERVHDGEDSEAWHLHVRCRAPG